MDRAPRALLRALGFRSDDLLGSGGEALVFALGDDRIVRVLRAPTPVDTLTRRVDLVRDSG